MTIQTIPVFDKWGSIILFDIYTVDSTPDDTVRTWHGSRRTQKQALDYLRQLRKK